MAKQRLADVDLSGKLAKAPYSRRLKALRGRLRRIELAYKFAAVRAVIVIEGWDAVGKGGVIRRLTSVLDPRGYQVWPIGPPTSAELAEHYLQRFWRKLPQNGRWALFDRSWYGRVLVERVEQLARPAEWRRAYQEINWFEKTLADDGVCIVKLFLHVSAEEQLRRLRGRSEDPLERWKMGCPDIRNYELRGEYTRAIDEMLQRTSTRDAPWRVVPFEDKRFGRIAAIEHVTKTLGRGMSLAIPSLAPEVAEAAAQLFARLDRGGKNARAAKK